MFWCSIDDKKYGLRYANHSIVFYLHLLTSVTNPIKIEVVQTYYLYKFLFQNFWSIFWLT